MPGKLWVWLTSNCGTPSSFSFQTPHAGVTPSRSTLVAPPWVGSGPTSTILRTTIGRYVSFVYLTWTGTSVRVRTGGGGGGGGNPGPGKYPPPKKLPTAIAMSSPRVLSRIAVKLYEPMSRTSVTIRPSGSMIRIRGTPPTS